MNLYLYLDLLSISIPLIFSFHPKIQFYKQFNLLFPSMFISGAIYIAWDVMFAKKGIWGFNDHYLMGIYLFDLPLEEWLFFICIPFASVFTHYTLTKLYPTFQLNKISTKWISRFIIVLLLLVILMHFDRAYTAVNASLSLAILIFALLKTPDVLKSFYLTFLVVLIPFFIVNGILTGSFIPDEIVWYNNAENLGIRLFTIPVEDIFYAFGMLLLTVSLMEVFRKARV